MSSDLGLIDPALPGGVTTHLVTAGSMLLAVAGIDLPVLQHLLGTEALGASEATLGVGAALVGSVAARLSKNFGGARPVTPFQGSRE